MSLKSLPIAAASICFLFNSALANPVTVKFAIEDLSTYDFRTSSYISSPNISGAISITFDIDLRDVVDYGTTTITTFGGVMGAAWDSPITQLLPSSPASGAFGPFYNSYVFPNVSDYPSTFIEEAAAQANTYQFLDGKYSAYHIEVRATRRTTPRSGIGTSDYAFSGSQLIEFYRSFQQSQEPVYFNESYETFTLKGGVPVYSDGYSWSSYSARVTDVIEHPSPVPEPSSLALLLAGSISLLAAMRRSALS